MLLNIIFSYNRVLQLDYLLKSVITRLKIDYKIVILYHTTGDHKIGYELLKDKYSDFKNISFVERKKVFFDWAFIRTLYSRENIGFFRTRNFFKPKADNFKSLLQNTIARSGCEFVMFNTDDGFFFKDVVIEDEIFEIIRNNSENSSYRLYVGENLEGQPNYVHKKNNYYKWDYYAEKSIHHWTFPFSVDGTIYNSFGLLKHLKRMVYTNPVTLEENGVQYIMRNKLFRIGLSPIESQLVCTKLNRVSVDTFNPTIHIKPKYLNEKFIEGYSLELVIPKYIDNANIVPTKVFIVKGSKKELIYTLDDYGKKVQGLLGIEGAKEQLE
ncbi:hypothetical protein [Kaistella jeonii]|uniref:Glycosyl transferase n=1 Tax=Kaistella jeonii TaxID=266749 RepID=A0A0C1D427_9FLAO|nr:hypothetical protein [Kaistella jeonii]KIA88530.1 hypothetical protein OA86_10915 [Kaistella jeonii]SFC20086.1 hypothetical protein SAMN05421876_10934 [Kaistella jeonii]VEI97003.1 Uncharacterised protein [Kaistella jeonii]